MKRYCYLSFVFFTIIVSIFSLEFEKKDIKTKLGDKLNKNQEESYPIDPRMHPFFQAEMERLKKKYGSLERMKEISEKKAKENLLNEMPYNVQEGDTEDLWAVNIEQSQYYQLSATCRGVGDNVYVMVEDAKWNDGTVTQTMVNNFIAAFDDDSNNVLNTPSDYTSGDAPNGDGIYGLDTYYFGDPPDIDGDPKICILLLDIQDGWNGSGGYIAGYFSPTNQTTGTYSNQREMIYIDVNPADPNSLNTLGNTVAHEFQHLIHYNLDVDETSWVNEACSEFAGYITTGSARGNNYYSSSTNDPLNSWGQDLIDYDQVSLFSVYFTEQTGNSTDIRYLAQDSANGETGVNNALAASGSTDNFKDLFGKYMVSNKIDDPASGYGYENINFSLMSDYKYHSNFPVTDESGNVDNTGTRYIKFTGGKGLNLTFNGADSGEFKLYAIKNSSMGNTVEELTVDSSNDYSGNFSNYGTDYDNFYLAVTNLTGTSQSFTYSATLDEESSLIEIAYDDGSIDETSEGYSYFGGANGSGFGVRFTPESYPVTVKKVKINAYGSNVPVEIHIYDDDGTNGAPGTDLITSFDYSFSAQGWQTISLPEDVTIQDGDFYIGLVIPGADAEYFAHDFSSPFDDRSWYNTGSSWELNSEYWPSQDPDYQEYETAEWMIRAIVEELDLQLNSINDQIKGSEISVTWTSAGDGYTYQIMRSINGGTWENIGTQTTDLTQNIICDQSGSWELKVKATKDSTEVFTNTISFNVTSVKDLTTGPDFYRGVNQSDTFLLLGDNIYVDWTDENINSNYDYKYAITADGASTPDSSGYDPTGSGDNDSFTIDSSEISSGGIYTLYLKCVNESDSSDYRIFTQNFNIAEYQPLILPNNINENFITVLIASKGLSETDKDLNSLLYLKEGTTTYNDLIANGEGHFYTQNDFNENEFDTSGTFNLYVSHSGLSSGDVEYTNLSDELTYKITNINENPYAVDRRIKLITENDKEISIIRINYPKLIGIKEIKGRIYHIGKVDKDVIEYEPAKGYKLQKWNGLSWVDTVSVDESGYYAVVDGSIVPQIDKSALEQNYPNPFNPETNIPITIKKAGRVKLKIYSSNGKLVKVLLNEYISSPVENKPIHWNGKDSNGEDVSSGIYYAVLVVNGERYIKKMVMLK